MNGRGRTGDRNAALFLELHVIHRRAVAAAFDVFDLVDSATVIKDPLAECCFTRVDVGGNTNVSYVFKFHLSVQSVVESQREQDTSLVQRTRGRVSRESPLFTD